MNQFEKHIVGDIPFGEGAAYFLNLKKMAAPGDPPDETGALEGQFPVPVEQVLQVLGQLVHNEFATLYAYQVYAQSLRDLSHDSIAEHFEEHSNDELEHAQFLLKRMAVLGGPVNVPDITAPAPTSQAEDIIKKMVRMEQEGIEGWKSLLAVVGDNPMKIKAEEYMQKEQEHLDDLWQLLPQESRSAVALPMGGSPAGAGTGAPAPGALGTGQPAPAELAASPYPPEKGGFKAAAVRMAKMAAKEKVKGHVVVHLHPKVDLVAKAKERAEANLAAKAKTHEGSRGEFYGDLIGRLVGAGAGGAAGRVLHGKPGALPVVAGAAVGQMLAGKAGKAVGKEIDTKREKSKHGSVHKRAFEEAMNYLAHEQEAEGAQARNEAAFYAEKAKQEAAARQQMEQQLQAASQQSSQDQAQLQQVQQAQQTAQQAATQAMMQAVSANQETIKHQQLASNTTMNLQNLRNTLRQLSEEAQPMSSGLDQGGPAAAPEGPAGQAPAMAPGPNAVSPTGEGQPPAQPQSPDSMAQGEPNSQAVMAGPERTKQGSAKKGKKDGEKPSRLGSILGSAAGGGIGGVGQLASGMVSIPLGIAQGVSGGRYFKNNPGMAALAYGGAGNALLGGTAGAGGALGGAAGSLADEDISSSELAARSAGGGLGGALGGAAGMQALLKIMNSSSLRGIRADTPIGRLLHAGTAATIAGVPAIGGAAGGALGNMAGGAIHDWAKESSAFGGGLDIGEEVAKRAPYALGGAGLGALMAGLTSAKGSAGAKAKVQQLEAEPEQGGFAHALQMARAKIQQAVGELAEQHPGGAMAIGAGMGALSGARQGPAIAEMLRRMG